MQVFLMVAMENIDFVLKKKDSYSKAYYCDLC